MCLLLAEAAEVRRRDIEQRGNVFQRKKLEEVGVADYQLIVALLWCFGIQVHETVIEGGKDGACRTFDHFAEPRAGVHHLGYSGARNAVNVARNSGDYRATLLLAVQATGKVADKMAGKFEANHIFGAVGRIADIFQRAGFNISDISPHGGGGNELRAALVMPQSALAAQIAPISDVDIVDIGVEL